MLDANSLSAPATHVDWATVDSKLSATLESAKILGHRFIIVPWVGEAERKQRDIWKKAADLFNRVGAESQKAGIQFAYHQHGFEFVPLDALAGKMPYDYLLENTDPQLVKMELDICWTVAAGQDPVAYFNRYPGRFPLVHVKDWLKDGSDPKPYEGALGPGTKFTGRMTNVGSGSVDWKGVFAAAEKGGVQPLYRRARRAEVTARRSARQLRIRARSAVLGMWVRLTAFAEATATPPKRVAPRRKPDSTCRECGSG